jgi:hypothetical protein
VREPRHATPQSVPIADCISLSAGAALSPVGVHGKCVGLGTDIPLKVYLNDAVRSWRSVEADPLSPSFSSSADPVE